MERGAPAFISRRDRDRNGKGHLQQHNLLDRRRGCRAGAWGETLHRPARDLRGSQRPVCMTAQNRLGDGSPSSPLADRPSLRHHPTPCLHNIQSHLVNVGRGIPRLSFGHEPWLGWLLQVQVWAEERFPQPGVALGSCDGHPMLPPTAPSLSSARPAAGPAAADRGSTAAERGASSGPLAPAPPLARGSALQLQRRSSGGAE